MSTLFCKDYAKYDQTTIEAESKEMIIQKIIERTLSFQEKPPVVTFETKTYFCESQMVHVVMDRELIIEVLHQRRNDQIFRFSDRTIEENISTDSMLRCPFSEHRRLRSPYERFFCKKRIEALYKRFAERALESAHNSYQFSKLLYLRQVIFYDILGMKEISKLKNLSDIDILWELAVAMENKAFAKDSLMEVVSQSPLLNEQEKLEGLKTLLLAGQDVTFNLLEFFVKLLESKEGDALFEEWNSFEEEIEQQKSLPQRISEFVKTSANLDAHYLELMRLYPVIPAIKRVAEENYNLNGTEIKKGDLVILNIMAAQRNENYFVNANDFDPSRFGGHLNKRSHILNFSIGSQHCLGQHLAEGLTKVAITCMIALNTIKRIDGARFSPVFSFYRFSLHCN